MASAELSRGVEKVVACVSLADASGPGNAVPTALKGRRSPAGEGLNPGDLPHGARPGVTSLSERRHDCAWPSRLPARKRPQLGRKQGNAARAGRRFRGNWASKPRLPRNACADPFPCESFSRKDRPFRVRPLNHNPRSG